MPLERSQEYLNSLLKEFLKLPKETEWVEFKHNNSDASKIGEYISALANSAALFGKQAAYMVWGIEDKTFEILGTEFQPSTQKQNQQELENWLLQKCMPKIHFQFFEFTTEAGIPVVILEVPAAIHTPVQFDGKEYIRVGSYKKTLRDFPDKERELWRIFDNTPFEKQFAAHDLSSDRVLKLLDYPAYFDLTNTPLPSNKEAILTALESEKFIKKSNTGKWHVYNLGAILFAKQLESFETISRKAIRLILYKGNNKLETIREFEGKKGYAVGFTGLIEYLVNLLPSNEEIGRALRTDVPIYPELALRELVANAIIHQDFSLSGTSTTIELFDNRLEITNPGTPLIDPQRFLDTPPQSRNEALASFMRRIGICEERGSGIDKVVIETEIYELPAPLFEKTENHTRATLFTHKELKEMSVDDKIRACYLHCCLKHVSHEPMNNTTVRGRFGIEEHNKSQASKIIKETVNFGLIKPYDKTVGVRSLRYIPFWAE